ncbi:hypothetical protein DVH24_032038 [Malus domestica]|uniref:Uncharacterized protein n=1 Tax=Malus domestica TaxID=3750 RepID=A0A498J8G3_MALDO|nr:hypothetical protein DVH24_032038 [Malus domestica]
MDSSATVVVMMLLIMATTSQLPVTSHCMDKSAVQCDRKPYASAIHSPELAILKTATCTRKEDVSKELVVAWL